MSESLLSEGLSDADYDLQFLDAPILNKRTSLEAPLSLDGSLLERLGSLDKLVPLMEEMVKSNHCLVTSNREVLTELKSVSARVDTHEARLGGVDTRLETHEARLETQEVKLETQEAKLETHEARLDELLQWKAEMTKKLKLTERSLHDPYSAAFSKSEDFFKVFSFMTLFAYDTVNGLTCAVFRSIAGNPCVCINFRALSNIAKVYLSGAKVSKMGMFPPFSLFRLNNLQRLFREAHLPEATVKKEFVMDLFKRSAVKPLKTAAANLSNWIALDMKAFVAGLKVIKRDQKFHEFTSQFVEHYPKTESGDFAKQKQVTEKDNVFVRGGDEEPDDAEKPIFNVPYWDDLFYEGMKDFRALMFQKQDHRDHQHFGNFLNLGDSEKFPIKAYDEVWEVEEEPEPPVKRKRRQSRREEPESDAEENEEEPEEPAARRIPQKRPRHAL